MEKNVKGNLRIEFLMAKAHSLPLMVQDMMGNGRMANSTVWELRHISSMKTED
jgi:hypothetical protein